MALNLFIAAIVIVICTLTIKISNKFGIPMLFLFIILGMVFGSDGILGIQFEDYNIASKICEIGLVFMMFYGGFGTNWKMGKPVAGRAMLMSSLGVIITAMLTGLFCHLVLKINLLESLLLGAVIGSTDAASVFSILRSKKLNLKNGLASLLEIESGSNDPTAFSVMIIILALMLPMQTISVPFLIFAQFVFGIVFGFIIVNISIFLFRKFDFDASGLFPIFILAVALLTYSVPTLLHGNGYLSVYIAGIVLGNSKIRRKVELVHFFDGITWLMQILIFFLLGLLSFPSKLPQIILPSLAILAFLTFIARPVATFSILSPFKMPFKQQLLVAWTGFKGASSIVFAIFAVTSGVQTEIDIFHIVFCVALLTILFQGTLLPVFAKKLDLIDDNFSVMKTFTDYQDDADMKLHEVVISERHEWCDKAINEIILPPDTLIVLIKRGNISIIPKGNTIIRKDDRIFLNSSSFPKISDIKLTEKEITKGHPWVAKKLKDLGISADTLVVLIKRDNETIIPKGDTYIKKNDILVMSEATDKV
jgi:cell volume regulation protein A